MIIAADRRLTRTVTLVAVGLGASLVLPLLVHLVPVEAGPPMGARLLPIFYATLVLALRGGVVPALAVSVIAPLLNRLLTGMPAGPMLPTLLLELTTFAVLVLLAARVVPRVAPYLGPVAYAAAAVAVRLVLVPDMQVGQALLTMLQVSWPGLVMLLAVGALAGQVGRRAPNAGAAT